MVSNWTSSVPGVDGSSAHRVYVVDASRRRSFSLNQVRSTRALWAGKCLTLSLPAALRSGPSTGTARMDFAPEGLPVGATATVWTWATLEGSDSPSAAL